MDKFSILSKTINGIVIFLPKGYVNDLGAEGLERTCEEFLSKGMRKVIINFSEIQYINSIGASIFTGIVQKIAEHNGMLCFTNMKKVHNDVFAMLGITRHAKVFKEEKDAVNFLKESD